MIKTNVEIAKMVEDRGYDFQTALESIDFGRIAEEEETRKEINTLMNIEGVRHDMSLAREEQYHKGYCKAVEDMCNLLKALDSQKAVLKKNK